MATPKYLVAIFGGAVSGSEAAHQLALRGIPSVVFDMKALPYGKIEDGLPKWHVKLRDKEQGKINEKLSHPLVTFVPKTKLGDDISFEQLVSMGFSAVLLATGAWRDRPLGIEGIDNYVDKGLIYQNTYFYWYNHKHEPGIDPEKYPMTDGVGIIGGGLASLDVAKVLMFEMVEKALTDRGIDVNLFELDRSISKVLDKHNLTLEDLGIRGCTIYYRRRIKDMPLYPGNVSTPEEIAKAQAVRTKVLTNYQSKYLFNMEPNHVPVDKIVEGDRLVGLVFKETEIVDGSVKVIEDSTKEVRFPYVISSIGSLPEKIPGIPTSGTTYEICCEVFSRLKGYSNIFALGNAVTGRGNIKESMAHGREIAQNVIEGYLSDAEGESDPSIVGRISDAIQSLEDEIRQHDISADNHGKIMSFVESRHEKLDYTDYNSWIAKHLPERLEDQLGSGH